MKCAILHIRMSFWPNLQCIAAGSLHSKSEAVAYLHILGRRAGTIYGFNDFRSPYRIGGRLRRGNPFTRNMRDREVGWLK